MPYKMHTRIQKDLFVCNSSTR